MQAASIKAALQISSNTAPAKFTPEVAFQQGTNLRKALRYEPEQTRAALLAMVADLCKFVDAKRTLTTDGELIFCVEAILDDYPALTIEEFKLICDGIKKGTNAKLYERLKVAEITQAIRDHESNVRAPILERMNRGPITRGVDDVSRIKCEPQTMNDVLRKRWFEKFERTTTNGEK